MKIAPNVTLFHEYEKRVNVSSEEGFDEEAHQQGRHGSSVQSIVPAATEKEKSCVEYRHIATRITTTTTTTITRTRTTATIPRPQTMARPQSLELDDIKLEDKKNLAKKFGTELFHQTDAHIAQIILRTQEMKLGSRGLAGGGIYFATTPQLTFHKARAHGVTLKAYVRLGRILTLREDGDEEMCWQKLSSKGFDSVCIARRVESGHEYVVYDPAQVLYIERHDTRDAR